MSLHKHFDSSGPNLLIEQHLCRWRYPLFVFYFLIMLINREKKTRNRWICEWKSHRYEEAGDRQGEKRGMMKGEGVREREREREAWVGVSLAEV